MAFFARKSVRIKLDSNNPYHSRYIDQFCEYADLVAESAKTKVIEMNRYSHARQDAVKKGIHALDEAYNL